MSSGAETAPLVSAIVTLYNQGHFARATIESVLAQDYRPVEVIVVDDGSTDDTAAICAGFGDRITYLQQPNTGAGAARNTGMRRARGALLAFLDGDDIWDPGKIGAQVAAARAHHDAGVVVVDGVKFEDESVLAPTLYYGPVQQHFAEHGGTEMITECYEELLQHYLIHSPSQIMIRREVFSRVGPWDARIRVSSDYELMLRIGAAGYPFVFLADALIRYRIVASSLSGPADRREFTWGLDGFLVFRAHAAFADRRHCAMIVERLRGMTRSLARRAYYHGERFDRSWSRRYLVRLAVRSRRPHLVIPYLVAALLPPWIVELASRVISRPRRGSAPLHDFRSER